MKFGKDLQQYRAPGWEDDYIDYKGLKLILKQLESPEVNKEEVDAEFFQQLEENLEKVWEGHSRGPARRGRRLCTEPGRAPCIRRRWRRLAALPLGIPRGSVPTVPAVAPPAGEPCLPRKVPVPGGGARRDGAGARELVRR